MSNSLSLSSLAHDILIIILSYIRIEDVLHVRLVSKYDLRIHSLSF
jgi:septum formation topological specificity factor MinE